MAQSTNSRNKLSDFLLYNVVAGGIIIVGVFSFAYVSQQMRYGSGNTNITIEVSRTPLSPVVR